MSVFISRYINFPKVMELKGPASASSISQLKLFPVTSLVTQVLEGNYGHTACGQSQTLM